MIESKDELPVEEQEELDMIQDIITKISNASEDNESHSMMLTTIVVNTLANSSIDADEFLDRLTLTVESMRDKDILIGSHTVRH